jgi:pimeloyl-ACP methyl ester carboxylesterase
LQQEPRRFRFDKTTYFFWLPSIANASEAKQIGIFFGHATGVPVLAYKSLFARLAAELGVVIATYDVPGFGASKDAEPNTKWRRTLWTDLAMKHTIHWEIAKAWLHKETEYRDDINWIFMGHSIGAWLSIWAAAHLGLRRVIALDLVWLPLKVAFLWSLVARLGFRTKHPVGRKSVTRRQSFASKEEAVTLLSRKSLFRGWNRDAMEEYVESLFEEKGNAARLIHDPKYEAALFYSQPVAMRPLFTALPKENRDNLDLLFVAGGSSDTCDYSRFPKLKELFPAATCVVIPEAAHMFPLANHSATIEVVKDFLTGKR